MESPGRVQRDEAILHRRLARMDAERRPRPLGSALLVPMALLVLPAIAALVLLASSQDTAEAGGENATLPAVAADPARFHGKEITITGAVEERYRRRAFSIGEPTSREDVLVLPRGKARRQARRETPRGTMRVTGKVRYVGTDLRGAIGGDVAVLRGGAAIVAEKIERVR